jgi:hypothetical protein
MPTDDFVKKCKDVYSVLRQTTLHIGLRHDRDKTFFQFQPFGEPPITIYNSETEGVIWGYNFDVMTRREKCMGKAVEVTDEKEAE